MFRELTEAEDKRLQYELAGIKVNRAAEKLKFGASEDELLENELLEAELEMMSYRLIGIK